MSNDVKEVMQFALRDMTKNQYNAEDLQKIIRVFDLCSDVKFSHDYKALSSSRFVMIAEEAKKIIESFAYNQAKISPEAVPAMEKFVEMFGKEYVRQSGKMVYEYSASAFRSKLMLKRMAFQNTGTSIPAKVVEAPVQDYVVSTQEFVAPVQKIVASVQEAAVPARKQTVMQYREPQQKVSLLSKLRAGIKRGLNYSGQHVATNMRRYALTAIAFFGLSGADISSSEAKTGLVDAKLKTSFLLKEKKAEVKIPEKAEATKVLTFANLQPIKLAVPTIEIPKKLPTRSFIKEEIPVEEVTFVQPKLVSSEVSLKNKNDYENFVDDLIGTFHENIHTLQNKETNKAAFYREQEDLIGRYGKPKHIIRGKSCESMSYATFLSVLEKNTCQDNYIAEACKNLLLKVPNPRACASNKGTFQAASCKNLRDDLSEKLKENKLGIYMIWTYNKKGGLHRSTVIGTGDGNAYLLAYNNNRISRMNIEDLKSVPAGRGFYSDLGNKIFNQANAIGMEKQNKQANDNYMAYLASYSQRSM